MTARTGCLHFVKVHCNIYLFSVNYFCSWRGLVLLVARGKLHVDFSAGECQSKLANEQPLLDLSSQSRVGKHVS